MKRFLSFILKFIYILVTSILAFIAIVGRALLSWFEDTFGVSIIEIMYTIKSPMKGADTHFLKNAIISCIPAIIIVIVFMIVLILIFTVMKQLRVKISINNKFSISILPIVLVITLPITAYAAHSLVIDASESLSLESYLWEKDHETFIYNDYYVTPDPAAITSESPKNLLYIYLESMETTYASVNEGGYQPENNYIPHLTDMAYENISFSDDEKLGGFFCVSNTAWTQAALFATESGAAFNFPIDGNSDFTERETFAGGIITLGDILAEKGYYQEFLCGSDAVFGGRKAFYEQHGDFEIFDYYTAIEHGYITEDDYVWWGLEDKNLYKIAKDELTRMAELDQPFNLTMLTVDTHHVDGWVCDLCEDKYPDQLANVVECADRQIYEFIEWCKTQDWYEDTVIVIEGDHTRMDTSLVEGFDQRAVYNCFINTDYDPSELKLQNRLFTPMDMFPTVLSSIGFDIPGDRLGLGTDMFSGEPTLAERYGIDWVSDEVCKFSSYYIENFS